MSLHCEGLHDHRMRLALAVRDDVNEWLGLGHGRNKPADDNVAANTGTKEERVEHLCHRKGKDSDRGKYRGSEDDNSNADGLRKNFKPSAPGRSVRVNVSVDGDKDAHPIAGFRLERLAFDADRTRAEGGELLKHCGY